MKVKNVKNVCFQGGKNVDAKLAKFEHMRRENIFERWRKVCIRHVKKQGAIKTASMLILAVNEISD